jgi:hypothetical protein
VLSALNWAHLGLLQTLRDRLAVHRKRLLDHELKREQAAASQAEDDPPSAGFAGPTLGASVGEVQVDGVEHPLPAQDEDVDRPEG